MGNNGILALFDIDGTLVRGARCHYQAFVKAVDKFYGMKEDISGINYAGKTDPQILKEVLELGGFEEEIIEKNFENCLTYMTKYYLTNVHQENVIALAGVKNLLDLLEKEKVFLGLSTGNLEPIAYAKLKRAGINEYFPFGGFGSDHAERPLLVKKAIETARVRYNYAGDRIYVIGDTPRDVDAGIKAGARTIAVATGRYSTSQLQKTNVDFIMDDLTDHASFMRNIGL